MFTITREIEFCYGHRLFNYEGKCKYLHGHNGKVVIALEGPNLDHRGMLVDFADIKATIKRWIDDNLDHTLLLCRNDPLLPLLQQQQEKVYIMEDHPTAENIARLIFEQAVSLRLPVIEVALWETSQCLASFHNRG